MNRYETVAKKLVDLADTIQCSASILPLAEYEQYPINPTFRYGWMPPIWLDREERSIVIGFCPELIASMTEYLTDDAFELYMDTIAYLITKHVALLDDIDDALDRHCAAEDDLPEHLSRLLSDVQFRALDTGLVVIPS